MATGGETSIGDPPGFAMLLSPRLDTYVAFGELYRLDGTAEDLPFANGSGFGEDWLYSDDGSLLSNNSGTIVSVDGEFEPFRINRRRFAEARTTVITKPPTDLDTTATTAAP